MPLYTGTGDAGETGLFGNTRVAKDHGRIEAYGSVDELNAVVGLLRSEVTDPDFDAALARIQSALFEVGADLATEGGQSSVPVVTGLIEEFERWTDESEQELPALKNFILPGGTREAALLHVVRTVARRTERRYWSLAKDAQNVPREIGIFLNRLSDLCFSWARRANHRAGRTDEPWTRG